MPRPRGSLNKRTLARLRESGIREQLQATKDAERNARKLAKEHLQDFVPVLAGMAAYYQPTFPGMPQQNPRGNEKEFERWLGHFLNIARTLAPYESATYRAIDLRATLPNDHEANPQHVMKALLDEIDGESRLERQQARQIEHQPNAEDVVDLELRKAKGG